MYGVFEGMQAKSHPLPISVSPAGKAAGLGKGPPVKPRRDFTLTPPRGDGIIIPGRRNVCYTISIKKCRGGLTA